MASPSQDNLKIEGTPTTSESLHTEDMTHTFTQNTLRNPS
jgi:hypothetical protein